MVEPETEIGGTPSASGRRDVEARVGLGGDAVRLAVEPEGEDGKEKEGRMRSMGRGV